MTRKKQSTIFRVEVVLLEGGRYPCRKTCRLSEGYYTSLEEAEHFPCQELYTYKVLFFIVTEIFLNHGDIDWIDFNTVRIYDADSRLLDKVECDEELTFHGREKEMIKFQVGDVVEVYDYFENKLRLGIVAKLPYTVEQVEKFHKEHDGIKLTMDNDRYGICYLDQGYKLGPAVFVMAPFKKVTKSLRQRLAARQEQYNKNKSNN